MLRQSLRNAPLRRLLADACRSAASSSAPWPPSQQDDANPCSTSGSDTFSSRRHGYPGSLNHTHSLHFWSFGKQKADPAPPADAGGADLASPLGGAGAGSALSEQQHVMQQQAQQAQMFEPAPVEAVDTSSLGFPLPEGSSEVASAIMDSFDAVEISSVMAAKALAWSNSALAISGLTAVHENLGLPWWASIAVFNLSLRLAAFPLMVLSQKAGVQLMSMNHRLVNVKKLYDMAAKSKSQEEHARLVNAAQAEYKLQTKSTGNPMVTALKMPAVMILNGIVFVSIYGGVTTLMAAKVPSLTTGGALWFTDLTVPDPWMLLPMMCCAVTLGMIQVSMAVGGDMNMAQSADQAKQLGFMKNMMRFAAFMFLPAGFYVSAGTAMLWVSNSSFMVCQGLLLRNQRFRTLVGLPSLADMKKMQAEVSKANDASAGATPAPPPGTAAVAALAALPPRKLFPKPPPRR